MAKNIESSKIEGTDEAWDLGQLGNEEEFIRRASKGDEAEIADALGLQLISLRLSKELINDLKIIAQFNGIGYQPLMRDVLTRFTTSELKKMAIEYANQRAEKGMGKSKASAKKLATSNPKSEKFAA